MEKSNLVFQNLSEKKCELEKKLVEVISAHNKDCAVNLLSDLKKNESQEKLKIAFVGQHNSGKSTIISALTDNKSIKISTNVETDVPSDYEWNDVILTDTPGLYAGKKEEHDVLSLQKIKESDILAFCITTSLFDDLLIKNFVDLAYNQAYKSKIFLVINKMSQEDGDFSELVSNYKKTLSSTLGKSGGFFEDFPSSFIDAHDYIDGKTDGDDELVEFSNFSAFTKQLNDYIKDKGHLGKLDTPCRIMLGAIDSEIAATGTELDRNMISILRQSDAAVRKYASETRFTIRDMEENLRSEIMRSAGDLIAKIGNENVGENDCEQVNKSIEDASDRMTAAINEKLSEIVKRMESEIGDVLSSDMANFVFDRVKNGSVHVNSSIAADFSKFISNFDFITKGLEKGNASVLDMVVGKSGNLSKISTLSGGKMHSAVLKTGHFFGKSFKPYQALKISGNIGKVTKVLGPVLSVVPVILDLIGKAKEDSDIQKVQNAKIEAFNQFSGIASDIVRDFDAQYLEMDKAIFKGRLDEIENVKSGILQENSDNSAYVTELKALRSQICDLIAEIVSCS